MSVPCLLDSEKQIEVQDELESFLHVLIYDGLRFVGHNLTRLETHDFFKQYFDAYSVTLSGETCGPKKLAVIQNGELRTETQSIVFGPDDNSHPLNGLIHDLLDLFKARLKVYQWNKSSEKSGTSTPAVLKNTIKIGNRAFHKNLWAAARGTVQPAEQPEASNAAPRRREAAPDALTEDKAEKLKTHAHVLSIIGGYLERPVWPSEDTHDDDFMVGYDQNELPPPKTQEAGKKKARTDIHTANDRVTICPRGRDQQEDKLASRARPNRRKGGHRS